MPTLSGHLDHNPYVGPRPIQQGEPIYGRDAEVEALYCELQARRIVVLHSPSGAGKSSLVQAGLIPKLEAGGFAVWRPIRVNLDLTTAEGVPEGTNRYLLSALSSLEDELPRDKQRSLAELAQLDFSTYLQTRPRRKKQVGRPLVLLFDQFEEVLTVAPQAVEAKRAFFSQMGQALEHENTWALLIIREDFLAAFAPYRDRLPTHMTNTFRLDLLGVAGAREAALRPAESAGREFPAVDQLVRDLSITKVQQADGSVVAEPGIYVEPVQLQVVCRRLWASMPEDAASIEHEHIAEYASVSESLAAYYAQAMAEVSGGDLAIERTIREWVGETLIVGGIRSQVRLAAGGAGRDKDETTAALDRARIQGLLDTYLIRVEPRAGVDWYELSHDRLVEPVQQDNERWAHDNLHPVQVQAKLWVNGRRAPGLLLSEAALPEAIAWAQDNDARLTEDERGFLVLSQELRESERRERRAARRWRTVATVGLGVMVTVTAGAVWNVRDRQTAIEAQSVEISKNKDVLNEQKGKLAENNRGLKVRLAVSLGQQASIKAEIGGQELDAVRTAVEAIGELMPNGGGQHAPMGGVDSELANGPGHSDTALADWLDTEPLPFEVFKGLMDGLARVQAGVRLLGHEDSVNGVAYSPEGTQLATTGDDKTVRLWNAHSGAAEKALEGHEGPVQAVAYSPDGRWLATASADKTVRLWDRATGQALEHGVLRHAGAVQSVAVSPEGARVATTSGNAAWVWHLGTDAIVVPLVGHEGLVTQVVFSPDGSQVFTASQDKTVRIWDAQAGTLQRTLEGHEGPVFDVAVSADGTTLATASQDKTVRLWTVATGETRTTLAHGDVVLAVALSPDGTRLATATHEDNAAHLWEVATGSTRATRATSRRLTSFRHDDLVVDVALSPQGDQLATASWDKTARSWSTTEPTGALTLLQGHAARVDALAVSADGTRLVTASGDHTARVWDAQTGAPRLVLRGHTLDVLAVAISPDGTQIVTSSWDKTARVWNAQTGALLHTLHGHTAPVVAVTVSADGTRLVTASDDHTARVWDLATGTSHHVLEHEDPVAAVVFVPGSERVVTVVESQPAQWWNVATGEAVPKAVTDELVPGFPHDDPVTAVAVSPDGGRLAVATKDRTVRLWEIASAEPKPARVLKGHTNPVRALAFSADGTRLASASEDGRVRVWTSVGQGAQGQGADVGGAVTSLWHEGPVTSVAFVGDGTRVATASGDEVARVWSLKSRDWLAWGCSVLDGRGMLEGPDALDERAHKRAWVDNVCTQVTAGSQRVEWPERNGDANADTGDSTESPEVITVHGVELVLIPGGSFMMGSPEGQGYTDEHPQHEVTLDSFYLARTEVTNAQYALYLAANPDAPEPQYWHDTRVNQPDQPVMGVSWFEAKAYCDWAGLSLPTETQWEYAARAGTSTEYWFGDQGSSLQRFAWVVGNAAGRTHAVGTKGENLFGLNDVAGNVDEWCLDIYGPYTTSPRPGDGLRHEPVGDADRVRRGGNWSFAAQPARSAIRYGLGPFSRIAFVGLRPAQGHPWHP